MSTLHISPGLSAGGLIVQAVRGAERPDKVLSWPDDLSCGPIDSDDPAARAAWWARFDDDWKIEDSLREFWERVRTTDDRLVVWFGRHSASELAFFLAWTDRLRDRPFDIVDVTGLVFPLGRKADPSAMSDPMQAVGMINPERLRTLLGRERPATALEVEQASQNWRKLKLENTPFRVVTATGLVSAQIDYFDSSLLQQATSDWKRVLRVVGEVMAFCGEPYLQVGDTMLLARVVALVGEGKLLADGDPRDMRSCRVRLPR
ncbi:MAG TPA: DUF3658 domain-containing protein [Dongiaceae bacterium]|nr:DUF3658 domain-containing protein [Dongiaceae bacterium]